LVSLWTARVENKGDVEKYTDFSNALLFQKNRYTFRTLTDSPPDNKYL